METHVGEKCRQPQNGLAKIHCNLLIEKESISAISIAVSERVVVENNALSDIAENKASGITQQEKYQKAQDALVKATEEFKAKNFAGLCAEACGAKMDAHRDELLVGFAEAGSDFIPVYGDIKSFAEANSALDYLAAVIGIMPGLDDEAGALLKGADKALKAGDLEAASKLLNKASDEVLAVSGSKGKWSKELNNPLPNKTYKLDANKEFETDSMGRTESVESTLYYGLKMIVILINSVKLENVVLMVMKAVSSQPHVVVSSQSNCRRTGKIRYRQGLVPLQRYCGTGAR